MYLSVSLRQVATGALRRAVLVNLAECWPLQLREILRHLQILGGVLRPAHRLVDALAGILEVVPNVDASRNHDEKTAFP